MMEIKLTKGKTALINDGDFGQLNKFRWYCNHYGYAVREKYFGMMNGKRKRSCVWMHREILKTPNGLFTDHINGDRLDNRRENLRMATNQQNKANEGLRKTNTSGYKGVTWDKDREKWMAQIMFGGKHIWIAHCKTRQEAAKKYDQAAINYFGSFAKLNFVV